jgi:hypothetical protein
MLAPNLEQLSLQQTIDSDEPEIESNQHLVQFDCLKRYWSDRHDFLVAGNLGVYYSRLQSDPHPQRHSWVVWQEGGESPKRRNAEAVIQQEPELRARAEQRIAELEAEIARLVGEHG